MEKRKIVIVGGGPAGIACGVEAKTQKIEPIVILERAPNVCHTIVKFYKPGKRVDANYRGIEAKAEGVCSFETETKEEFLKRIETWIKEYDLDIKLESEVTDIKKSEEGFEVRIKGEPAYIGEFVVVAIGIFGQPKKPSYAIPKEVKDRVFFEPPLEYPKGKKVLVVGGGNTAAEVACALADNENDVTLSYRRPRFFRINPINLKSLEENAKSGKIKLLLPSDIEKVEIGDAGKVKVFYKDGKTEEYEYVYYCFGGSTPKGFLQRIGIEFDENGRPKIDEHFETNVPKLFLAGDIAVKQGNIISAFNSAHRVIKRIREKYLS